MTYLPHFISVMVVCGLIYTFTAREGLFNDIIDFFGGERSNLLTRPECFRAIFVGLEYMAGVWLGKHHLSGGSVRSGAGTV